MTKAFEFAAALLLVLLLSACGEQRELVNMESSVFNETYRVIWENRIYEPFCVVSKQTRGVQIGYIDGDFDHRISEYKGYPPEEWLLSWLSMDGGALLMKEASVVDIPEGLEKEY